MIISAQASDQLCTGVALRLVITEIDLDDEETKKNRFPTGCVQILWAAILQNIDEQTQNPVFF